MAKKHYICNGLVAIWQHPKTFVVICKNQKLMMTARASFLTNFAVNNHYCDFQVSLVGLSALLALLHHSEFYQEMMILLSNYYPQPAIHPISVVDSSPHNSAQGSQATLTTNGQCTETGTQGLSVKPLMPDSDSSHHPPTAGQ
jgi:hypothetical protein